MLLTFETICMLAADFLRRHIQMRPVNIAEPLLNDLVQLKGSVEELKKHEKTKVKLICLFF